MKIEKCIPIEQTGNASNAAKLVNEFTEQSLEIMKKEQETGIVNGPTILNMMSNQKPEKLNFGQAVVFNPFLLHGNTVFNSEYARIACTTRFQSSNKPLLQKNTDYLKFYSLN